MEHSIAWFEAVAEAAGRMSGRDDEFMRAATDGFIVSGIEGNGEERHFRVKLVLTEVG